MITGLHKERSAFSNMTFNRRVVLKASAILASLVTGQGIQQISSPEVRAAATSTASYDWYELDELGAVGGSGDGESIIVETHFPFTAVGAHWDVEAGEDAVVELQVSLDGVTWSESYSLSASHDNGPPSGEARVFTGLVCAAGATHIAYAVYDGNGHRTALPGFALTYIDSSGGPLLPAVGAESSVAASPPQIVTRAEWGADESYRFTESGEWWTLQYDTVRHAIIHHSETSNVENPIDAIRAIYHYHAVTRGWHDIGYNFLVDRFGTIYQGRSGGQNVVAGHAKEFSHGSAGIAFIGNHTFAELSDSALASMVAIVAWSTRQLDPWGFEDFNGIGGLPTICGHRDVMNTACPGEYAYDEMETIRSLVAQTLASTLDGPQSSLALGDYVQLNDDLNLRSAAGTDNEVLAELSAGVNGMIDAGPVTQEGMVWFRVVTDYATGWTIGDFLDRNPPLDWKRGRFGRDELVSLAESASLRQLPSVNAPLISMLEAGDAGSILGGPEEADENRWYKVDTAAGEGWVAARFLTSGGYGGVAVESVSAGGSSDHSVGDQVIVYDGPVNLRSGPSVGAEVLATLDDTSEASITSGPVTTSGVVWFEVESDGAHGWVDAAHLSQPFGPGSSATVSTGGDGLMLRSLPGSASEVIAVAPDGTVVTVLAGPESADGYTWWQVECTFGTGWAAGAYLEPL